MPLSVRYHFSQRFNVSAQKAFNWCTDFDPKDHALMGDENAERQVINLTEGTIILRDKFHSAVGTFKKEKLIQIYPDQLSWVSTHLTGPNKYSQFLYRITPESKNTSILDFTGLHLEYEEKETAKVLAQRLCRDDADAWKLLAKAMTKDLET
jgi:hypothetical protein